MTPNPLGKKKEVILNEKPHIARVKNGKITSGEVIFRLKLERVCRKALTKYGV